MRVNNAFSPINATHQPYGWDQMAALYRFYKVVGCKIKISAANNDAKPMYLLVRQVPVNENSTMNAVDVATIGERPDCKVHQLPAVGGPVVSTSFTVDLPRLLGITPEQFDADTTTYSALCTAAPSSFTYVQVGCAGAANTAFADVFVEVEYLVHFWQRITQAQS